MQMQKRQKLLFVVTVILVIITFLSTFIITGCGRRAKIIAAKEKAGQAEEQNEQSQTETVKESGNSDTEETVKESTKVEESTENKDGDTSESEVSAEDEETTASESAQETTAAETNDLDALVAVDLPYVEAECANIYGNHVYVDSVLMPGDSGNLNYEVRSFISFDISQLADATIESAKISGKSSAVKGTPIAKYGPMIIKAVYWGARAVSLDDFSLDGIEITNNSKNNFSKTLEVLKDDLQKVVDSGINRYQLCFYFEMPQADGDGEADDIYYPLEDIDLSVTYSK
jgi:cytoskeletal protein RodZ